MKKLCVAICTFSILMFGTAADAKNNHSEPPMMGGWQETESSVIPDEVQTALDKAILNTPLLDATGTDYRSVAYLGYQVVAGKNHCMLCRSKTDCPNVRPYYALVYFYEDLEGNSKITNIVKLDLARLSEKKN